MFWIYHGMLQEELIPRILFMELWRLLRVQDVAGREELYQLF